MSAILAQYGFALRSLIHLMRHPVHQAFVLALVVVIAIGIVFYSVAEGWSLIDSFYFTIVALSTIGFGDLAPTSESSRLFTAFYAIVGVGIIGVAIHLVVSNASKAVQQARDEDDGAKGSAAPEPGER